MYFRKVASANNEGRPQDGVYQCAHDPHIWFITCTHADSEAKLFGVWNSQPYCVRYANLRNFIKFHTGIQIPDDDFVLFTACHPGIVKRTFPQTLIEANMDCLGNWDGPAWYGVGNIIRIPGGDPWYRIGVSDKPGATICEPGCITA